MTTEKKEEPKGKEAIMILTFNVPVKDLAQTWSDIEWILQESGATNINKEIVDVFESETN